MFLLSKDTITKKVIGTVSEKDCPSCKKNLIGNYALSLIGFQY